MLSTMPIKLSGLRFRRYKKAANAATALCRHILYFAAHASADDGERPGQSASSSERARKASRCQQSEQNRFRQQQSCDPVPQERLRRPRTRPRALSGIAEYAIVRDRRCPWVGLGRRLRSALFTALAWNSARRTEPAIGPRLSCRAVTSDQRVPPSPSVGRRLQNTTKVQAPPARDGLRFDSMRGRSGRLNEQAQQQAGTSERTSAARRSWGASNRTPGRTSRPGAIVSFNFVNTLISHQVKSAGISNLPRPWQG